MAVHTIRDEIMGVTVKVGPLLGGEGIDLAVQPPGARFRTVQLGLDEARAVARALLAAADESERL